MSSLKFSSRIDLDESTRAKLVDLLNKNLANGLILQLQVKHAHWNVRGRSFQFVHELFDELLDRLQVHSDDIAERAAMLGGVPFGTAKRINDLTSIPEYDFEAVTSTEHIRALADRFGAHASELRKAIAQTSELEDAATEDVFTAILRDVEKDLWFLESHLQA